MPNREMTTPRRGRPPAPHNRNRQRSITRDESRNQQQPSQWQQQQQQHTASSQSTPSQSRYNSKGNGGGGGHRGKLVPSTSATQSEQQSGTTNGSPHVLLLQRVLFDEDDMQRRTAATQQLIKSLEESLQHGDPTQMQYEGMQLVDMCILKQPSIRPILEMNRPHSSGLKAAAVKLISTLALCSCRLDIVFVWIFDYLQRWSDGDDNTNKTKEFKIWLLRALRQVPVIVMFLDPTC